MLLRAEFAVETKLPGTRVFGVLWKSHGTLGQAGFERIFESLNVGTPSKHSSYAAQVAPWAVFGGFSLNDAKFLAVVREDYTEHVDNETRPILAACCFCIPFTSISSAQISYTQLFRHLPPTQELVETAEEGLPYVEIAVDTSGDSSSQVANRIDGLEFDWAAGVAALLLQTPIAIVEGNFLSVDDRLAALDAFNALLPYGIRATLRASIWAQSVADYSVHLAFSDAARSNQQRIEWGQPIGTALRAYPVANEYYQNLRLLRDRYDTRYLVERLASLTSPLPINEPRYCLSLLIELDKALSIWRAVLHDPGGQQIRGIVELFKTGSANQLSRVQERDLLKFLLLRIDETSTPVLRDNWQSQLADNLREVALECVDAPVPNTNKLRALVGLASEVGEIDGLIVTLLKKLTTLPPSSSNRRSLVQFLASVYAAYLKTWQSASFEELTRFPEVLHEHLLQLCEADRIPDARRQLAAATSVRGDLSGQFRLLETVLGGQYRELSRNVVDELAWLEPEFVRRTLAVALLQAPQAMNTRLIDIVTSWLLERADELPSEELENWSTLFEHIAYPRDLARNVQAKIQLLSAIIGVKRLVQELPMRLSKPREEFHAYVAALKKEVGGIVEAGRSNIWVSLVKLIDAHDPKGLTEAENMIELLFESHGHLDTKTRRIVSDIALRQIKRFAAELASWLYHESWIDLLMAHHDAVSVQEEIVRATLATNRVRPPQAAERCARFIETGGHEVVPILTSLLGKTSYIKSADDFWEFVRCLRDVLLRQWLHSEVLKVEVTLLEAVLDRKICAEYREQCLARAIASARQDIQRSARILGVVGENGKKEDLLAIRDTATEIFESSMRRTTKTGGIRWPRKLLS